MGHQPFRGPGEPGSHRLHQGSQRGRVPPPPVRHAGGGGVHLLAGRLPPHLPGRPRLRLQMEHGVDERHAGVLRQGSHPPALPPPRADVRPAVRLHRELHPAPEPRRGGTRQGIAAHPDARGPLAAVREPARAAGLDVGASRPAAALHGRRDRPERRVAPRPQHRLAPARLSRARGSAGPGPGAQHRLPPGTCPLGAGLRLDRLPLDRPERRGQQRAVVSPVPGVRRAHHRLRGEPHPGAAARLPRRASPAGALGGDLQLRQLGVRRQQRPDRRRHGRGDQLERPGILRRADGAAAGRGVAGPRSGDRPGPRGRGPRRRAANAGSGTPPAAGVR